MLVHIRENRTLFNVEAGVYTDMARRYRVVSVVYRMFGFSRIRRRLRVRMRRADCVHMDSRSKTI